jgi:hypothetical protein
MDTDDKELLRAEVEALDAALAEARFRHVAGIDAEPSLGPIFRAHHRAAHRASVRALEEAGDRELAARVAALRAERVQAADEEAWRAAEATAAASGPDGTIALEDAQLALPRERHRERRLALGRAVSAAASLRSREAAVEKRARARAEVGLTPDWDLVLQADALLSRSDDAYRDVLSWLCRREAELTLQPHGDLERADLLFVLALHRWADHFPAGMLSIVLDRTTAPLGLDLRRVRVDAGGRPAQWPGAHAFGARVSFRRQGGAADWLALLEASGQALAAGLAAGQAGHATRHTLGSLLAGLLLDRGFLASRLEVDRKQAGDLVRALALRQLFRLRTRAAALRVATEVERGTSGAAWHEAHREAMTLAAAAAWPAGLAARDGDAALSAESLRGAASAERLRGVLVERFDEDWWRNPRTAGALVAALAAGTAGGAGEAALPLAGEALVAKLQ